MDYMDLSEYESSGSSHRDEQRTQMATTAGSAHAGQHSNRAESHALFLNSTITKDETLGQRNESLQGLAALHGSGLPSPGQGAPIRGTPMRGTPVQGTPMRVPPARGPPGQVPGGPPPTVIDVKVKKPSKKAKQRRKISSYLGNTSDGHSSENEFPSSKVNKEAKWRKNLRGQITSTSIAMPTMEKPTHSEERSGRPSPDNGHENGTHKADRNDITYDDGELMSTVNTNVDGYSMQDVQPIPVDIKSTSSHRPLSLEDIESEQDLATALSLVAKKHVGVDLLNPTNQTAQYIGFLLDSIQRLVARNAYLEAGGLASETEESDEEFGNGEPKLPTVYKFRTLHEVVCHHKKNQHEGLFEDEPVLRRNASTSEAWFSGSTPVMNIKFWTTTKPDLCFIVTKEYICGATRPKSNQMVPQQETKAREIMKITSSILESALGKVASFNPYDGENDLEMIAPYPFFFHHQDQLTDLAREDDSFSAVLKPLLEFLKVNYTDDYSSAKDMFDRNQVSALHASKLFKPFEVIVVRGPGSHVEARMLSSREIYGGTYVNLGGWHWRYDGANFRRNQWTGSIKIDSREEIPISSLHIHPEKYALAEDAKKLKSRGEAYWNMRLQGFATYTGWDAAHERFYSERRIMHDTTTYLIMHPRSEFDQNQHVPRAGMYQSSYSRPRIHSAYDKTPELVHRDGELPEVTKSLLPSTINGFDLESKKWIKLNVDGFQPVEWNERAFEQLVLDARTKEMIYALVKSQRAREKKMDDIIKGKGNGLIILLHGGPGTGKTLTAESVAEIAHKPLYRVTCGDLGTDAEKVEKYLDTVLYLGKIWDCVLLLDEADVFLEERAMADIQRNSLVSVFLRTLEYHDGILILTSNRVGTFDEAFKSRIQVAIHYKNLTSSSRKAIWNNFFQMLEESGDDVDVASLENKLSELAVVDMNGRQIRNALLTARQLAKHRMETLSWEHLNQAMTTAADFNKYLESVRGKDDKGLAKKDLVEYPRIWCAECYCRLS